MFQQTQTTTLWMGRRRRALATRAEGSGHHIWILEKYYDSLQN
jgi:hypothetical protein